MVAVTATSTRELRYRRKLIYDIPCTARSTFNKDAPSCPFKLDAVYKIRSDDSCCTRNRYLPLIGYLMGLLDRELKPLTA
jgi:hypothetical protein